VVYLEAAAAWDRIPPLAAQILVFPASASQMNFHKYLHRHPNSPQLLALKSDCQHALLHNYVLETLTR